VLFHYWFGDKGNEKRAGIINKEMAFWSLYLICTDSAAKYAKFC